MPKFKCGHCGNIFEFEIDDLDIDYEVESVSKTGIEIVITISLRCPKCGKRILYGSESITIPFKVIGEFVK